MERIDLGARCQDRVFGDKAKGMIYKWLQTVDSCTWVEAEYPTQEEGKHRKRIDLACEIKGYRVGIEIKSSPGDLHSGYGLYQESDCFDFGYVVLLPRYNELNLIERTIGWLSLQGMENTGILLLKQNEDNTSKYHFEIVRDATSKEPFFEEEWTVLTQTIMDEARWDWYSYIKEQEDATKE